MFLSTTNLCN